jgi:hypothetical protein
MTAVAGATFTAAQFNQYVRDNLNMTAPALATAASQLFVSTGANAIAVRVPSTAQVTTSQSTTTTSFTDLTTPGPSITVSTGTIAIVMYAAGIQTNVSDRQVVCSVEVSGASSVAASDNWSIMVDGIPATNTFRAGVAHVFTGLTAGTNTFKMKYRVGTGSTTGTYMNREINVIPL